MEVKKTIIKTEKDLSTKTFVLNRFKNAEKAVMQKALIPIKACDIISSISPPKKPRDSEFINVEVKLL